MAEAGGFSIGNVVNTTFEVIGRNIATFAALSLVAAIPQTLCVGYLRMLTNAATPQEEAARMLSGSYWLKLAGGELLSVFFAYVAYAMLAYATVKDLNGQPVSFEQSLSSGVKSWFPVLAIGVLMTFGMVIGMVLLIVPGLILLTAWSIVIQVYAIENTGVIATFGRSAALTKGHRWKIFFLLIISGIAAYLVGLLSTPLLSASSYALFGIPVVFIIVSGITQVIIDMLVGTGLAVTYYQLRATKEGVGAHQLAEVFA